MASSRPVVSVHVDWANDGNFTTTGDDVTARVLQRDGVTIACGRDQARVLTPVSPGQARFSLNNTSRAYSPDNASSPLAGNLVPGRPVRIQAVQDATTYVLYRGFTDGYTVLPNRADRSVQFTCLDALARFGGGGDSGQPGVTLSTALYQGVRTGTAIGYILDAIGWPGAARDLDTGATIIRWWWEEGTDAYTALQKLLSAEGPPALAFVDTSGNFVFRDRHHRLIRAASTTVQATFSNGGTPDSATAATYSQPSAYDAGWRDIVNTVQVSCAERNPVGRPQVVWQDNTSASYAIPASGTLVLTVQGSDPFQGAITPDAGTDFTLLSGTATASLSRTSGQAVTITLTDSGTGSVVTGLQLRAYPVTVTQTTQVSSVDATSATAYGTRGLPAGTDLSWCSPEDAAAVAALITGRYAQRRPIVTLPIYNANGYRLTQQLSRDLSDRVHVTDSDTGLDADCFLERIEYTITSGGRIVQTSFGCEKAPTTVQPLVLDDATSGKLNTGGALGI